MTVDSDKYVALALFCLAGFLFAVTFNIPEVTYSVPGAGPATFPRLWAVLMAVLSLIIYIRSVLRERGGGKKISLKEILKAEKNVFLIFVTSIVYTILIPIAGFITSTAIFCIVTISVLGRYKLKRKFDSLWISLAVSIVTYCIFEQILGVILPTGYLI